MEEHSRLKNGSRYHNVQPAELATSHADAVFLSFSVGSAIDTVHAVGFKKSDNTYCAAPILDGTEADNQVQYWAVGDDDDMDHFKSALFQVEKAHGLAAPKTALFLRWTSDPNKLMDELWASGNQVAGGAVVVYLLVSIVFAYVLNHFLKLERR